MGTPVTTAALSRMLAAAFADAAADGGVGAAVATAHTFPLRATRRRRGSSDMTGHLAAMLAHVLVEPEEGA
eukprot:gene20687-51222_t